MGYSKSRLIAKTKAIRESDQEGAIEKGKNDFWFYKNYKVG